MRFILSLIFASACFPAVKQVPPQGIAVSDADRAELESGLAHLQTSIGALKGNPLLADAAIYHKAVRFALDGGEFYKPTEIVQAKKLLAEGQARADALASGKSPWASATGLIVRAYVSKIDGSVQPYGLVVPPSFALDRPHKWRLDAWFHGRGENLSEVNFITDREKNMGEFTPRDTIVLHLYGRYCNANKFAGEVDFFEALEDVKKHYNIDERRTLVRGFSMGGAAVWHLAAHHAGEWAAAAPGAGFAEIREYQADYRTGKLTPEWFEEKLWHLTNATDYALNFFQLPIVAYNGDIDPQKQAADMMAKAMKADGMTLTRVYGLNTGHKYHPDSKVEINRIVDSIAERGNDPYPKKIKFTTWTLAYNRMKWVTVDGLDEHWARATVEAEISNDHTVTAKTANVSAVTFQMAPGGSTFDESVKTTVVIDGQSISVNGPQTDRSWVAHFHKMGGNWAAGEATGLRKIHALQGPIDDAFMDSFVMVAPTGKPMVPGISAWVEGEMAHAQKFWRGQFRGDALVRKDSEINEANISQSNLILWGDPGSNSVLGRVLAKLPIQWTADRLTVNGKSYPAGSNAPVLIYPNPLNPAKYIVINSGMTFRESSNTSNSLQVATLPDFAVVDVSVPANEKWPGKIADAGFFGEHWESRLR